MPPQDMEMLDEVPLPEQTAAAADIDLPEHTANDIFMLEEEVEVERLPLSQLYLQPYGCV